MKKNVLITSVSGLTGVFLSKHLSKSMKYKLVGIDITEYSPAIQWLDSFYSVPRNNDINYEYELKKILESEQIDIIIPVSSHDIAFYCDKKNAELLQKYKVLIVDKSANDILNNKKNLYLFLKQIGLNSPQIYDMDNVVFPCIMKPPIGSGSKEVVMIENMNDLNYFKSKIKHHILVEYLEGAEFTVDCLFDRSGHCIGYNCRERLKTNGGGAVISKNNYSIDLEKIIRALEESKIVVGPVNFQFKKKNEDIYIFDFNTRFASGGLALTIKSGFDVPNMVIDILLGTVVDKWKRNNANDGLTMIRFYDEYYCLT